MKSKYLLIPTLLSAIALTSCNNGIKRRVYKENTYDNVFATYEKIKKAQIDQDNHTTLFDNGSLYFRYQLTAKGTMRYDDLSFHDIDAKLNAGYTISWSIKDNYLKVQGEKEDHYFIKHGDNYYQLKKIKVGNTYKKTKDDITSDVTYTGTFKDYFVKTINYYATCHVPFVMNITAGIDGELCDIEPIATTNFDFSADSFYTKDMHDKLEALSKKYKEENKGHSVNLTYGMDNDSSTCFTLKCNGNANDFHQTDYRQGEVNFDGFASFKDNFLSQFELKLTASSQNLRDYINVNMNIDMYISEEVSQNTCKVDQYNFDEFNDPQD